MRRDINQKTTEAKKEHIKNLSDHEMTRNQINLLSRGLNYIPTQVANESNVRKEQPHFSFIPGINHLSVTPSVQPVIIVATDGRLNVTR